MPQINAGHANLLPFTLSPPHLVTLSSSAPARLVRERAALPNPAEVQPNSVKVILKNAEVLPHSAEVFPKDEKRLLRSALFLPSSAEFLP